MNTALWLIALKPFFVPAVLIGGIALAFAGVIAVDRVAWRLRQVRKWWRS